MKANKFPMTTLLLDGLEIELLAKWFRLPIGSIVTRIVGEIKQLLAWYLGAAGLSEPPKSLWWMGSPSISDILRNEDEVRGLIALYNSQVAIRDKPASLDKYLYVWLEHVPRARLSYTMNELGKQGGRSILISPMTRPYADSSKPLVPVCYDLVFEFKYTGKEPEVNTDGLVENRPDKEGEHRFNLARLSQLEMRYHDSL